MRADGKGFIVTLYPEKTGGFQRKAYPEEVRQKFQEKSLLLEDVLLLGHDTKLRVVVFGYDSFSGARRIFESRLYGLNDIKEGRFKGLQIVVEHAAQQIVGPERGWPLSRLD